MIRRAAPLLVLSFAATAAAEEPSPSAPIEIQIIGDKADSLQKIPGSVTVVTRRDLARAEPSDVGEVLRRVPGLQVRSLSDPEGALTPVKKFGAASDSPRWRNLRTGT